MSPTATVATGMPGGICTMLNSAAKPLSGVAASGTPITGSVVSEASTPGRCAAAHLPGVLASLTTLPVIGVPLAATPLSGFAALLSIVQMPPGIPVATVAVGDMGARNAGHLAAQIIALSDEAVATALTEHRAKMRETARPPEGFVP